jgi:hypothetical protein
VLPSNHVRVVAAASGKPGNRTESFPVLERRVIACADPAGARGPARYDAAPHPHAIEQE